jgi:hypothetical protein
MEYNKRDLKQKLDCDQKRLKEAKKQGLINVIVCISEQIGHTKALLKIYFPTEFKLCCDKCGNYLD